MISSSGTIINRSKKNCSNRYRSKYNRSSCSST